MYDENYYSSTLLWLLILSCLYGLYGAPLIDPLLVLRDRSRITYVCEK